MDNTMDLFKELVVKNGDDVGMKEPVCVLWKSEHDNCFGCSSELGCSKMVAIMGVQMTPMMYQPKDYNDYETMQTSMRHKIQDIIEAKTPKEIKKIEW